MRRGFAARFPGGLAPTLMFLMLAVGVVLGTLAMITRGVASEAFNWKGRAWNLTTGGMAGVVKGNPANVFVDQMGIFT